jgi:hypothetical protein
MQRCRESTAHKDMQRNILPAVLCFLSLQSAPSAVPRSSAPSISFSCLQQQLSERRKKRTVGKE